MNDTMLSNQPVDEMTRLTLAAREALTDSMVERLAVTGANALELIDRLNDEQTSTAMHALIDRLTELHRAGALDTVCDLIMTVHAARNALTDNMVERLFAFFEHMINTVGNEAMGELAEHTRNDSANSPPPRGTAPAVGAAKPCLPARLWGEPAAPCRQRLARLPAFRDAACSRFV
jgi:hypothetical protein